MASDCTRCPACGQPVPAPSTAAVLSNQERRVAACIAEGLYVKEIGPLLGVSCDTVRSYVRRVYRKLGAHNRASFMAAYYRPTS